MARTSNTEMAVLGLLALGAQTGYDIRKECEEKLSHFWQESYGQIYPVLNGLNEREWVEKETVTDDGPRKHLYNLTETGRAKLTQWLTEPAQRMKPRNELLLKVFLGRMSDVNSLTDVIQHHKEGSESRLKILKDIRDSIKAESSDHPDATYWLITLDYGIRMLHAQLEWADESQNRLNEKHKN